MCHFYGASLYVDKGGIFISNETHKRSDIDFFGMFWNMFAVSDICRLSSRSPERTNGECICTIRECGTIGFFCAFIPKEHRRKIGSY